MLSAAYKNSIALLKDKRKPNRANIQGLNGNPVTESRRSVTTIEPAQVEVVTSLSVSNHI